MAGADYGGAVYKDGVHVKNGPADCRLGDGDVHVFLFKGWGVEIYKNDIYNELLSREFNEKRLGFGEHYSSTEIGFNADLEECWGSEVAYQLTIWRVTEDNNYIYGRLVQSDGTVWSGYSGYGVGGGFEDGCYGYRNKDRVRTLKKLLALDEFEAYRPSIFHVIARHYKWHEILPRIRYTLFEMRTKRFYSDLFLNLSIEIEHGVKRFFGRWD
jgi:hypothetical protein